MSDGSRREVETRVLLLAPTSRDGEAGRAVLAGAGAACTLCRSVEDLCDRLREGAGTVILPENVVQTVEGRELRSTLASQPVWSDLPVILLSEGGIESPAVTTATESLGNVTVIERPVRVSTLISVVRTALRARERQYQVRDQITERQQLLTSERSARAEAERQGRVKDEFLATLSHELRTPLNAILGWAQILASGNRTPQDLDEGLQTIERNARAQTRIIEDLLDMSRIISGKIRLEAKETDLAAVVRAAIDTVRPAAAAKQVQLMTQFDAKVEGAVWGDASRLQQVFWNLLSNAVKFTPIGGVVRVTFNGVDEGVEVCVRDSGEGIDPKFLPHVFDRFRQADATTARRHGGLGLGLAIARQLIELHGGTIRAESDGKGKGACFTTLLPRSHAKESRAGEARSVREAPRPPGDCATLEGLKVLIVDDEPDARQLVQRILQDCAAQVIAASSASEAIDRLRVSHPDVLISDIGMPEEDGFALIRQVRSLPPHAGGRVPAVALTAYARPEDRERALHAGFQMHATKPVEADKLTAMVASLGRGTMSGQQSIRSRFDTAH